MSDLSVRLATDSDIERARDILREAYAQYEADMPAENWLRYQADILDLEGRADASELLVAEMFDEVVACVSYYPPGSEVAYPSPTFSERWPVEWAAFRLLAVHPTARHLGAGRRLTEACIRRAGSFGAPVVALHTTAPMKIAREMYERMGFERIPEYDFQPSPEILVEAYRLLLPGTH